ncbi:MAG: MMPL family transporter [Actinomycetota bacterium]
MLGRLARFTIRRRRLILVTSLGFVIAAGSFGSNVADFLSSGGFNDPNSESTQAGDLLQDTFKTSDPNVLLLVRVKHGKVTQPDVVQRGTALTEAFGAEPGVGQAASFWTLGQAPPLASRDATEALVLAVIPGSDDHVHDVVERLSPRYTRDNDLVTVRVGGRAEIFRQVNEQIRSDLGKGEGIAIPITMLLLILVFGSVVAAGTPLAIGVVSIIGTMLILRVLASFTQVSIFSLNLTTAMGLGLGIDYSLFIVSRFREELRAGRGVEAALVRSVETAGRTVAFSAMTVGISLAALLVFPLAFLRSFAYAGISVVALAAVASLVFLPSLLATIGTRIDKWVLWRRTPKPVGEGAWHRIAMIVMRRPVLIGAAVVALFLFVGAPFLRVSFGLPDDRVEPTSATSRQVQDEIRTKFVSEEATPLEVVAPDGGNPRSHLPQIASYAARLSSLRGVSRVDALTGSYIESKRVLPPGKLSRRFAAPHATWFRVVPNVEPISPEGERLVTQVRALTSPFPVIVGGPSAELVDSKASIFGRTPIAAGIIALVTFVVLFLMTGSVLIPIKALVLNVVSLSATFGAMVWIFQEGHLSGFLGFTPTGFIDTTTPILMFCIAFGLSMDFEVFLLSRIKEEYDRTGDNTRSVAVGLERTGRIVTSAAALISVVFISIASSKITFIKLFGVGLTLAVLADATFIRGALVPAFMRLAGRANWWAPGPLRRLHARFGISEHAPDDVVTVPEPAAQPVSSSTS